MTTFRTFQLSHGHKNGMGRGSMKGLRKPKPSFMPKLEPWPSKREGLRYLDGCRRMAEQLAKVIADREAREYEAAVMAWESEGGR